MKSIILFLFLIIKINILTAEVINVSVYLPQNENENYKVKLEIDSLDQNTNYYYLQGSSLNKYSVTGFNSNIGNIKVLNDRGEEISYKIKNNSLLVLKNSKHIKSIEYEVLQFSEKLNRKNFFAGGILRGKDHQLINYNAIVGYFNDHTDFTYNIKLFNNTFTYLHSSATYQKDESVIYTSFNNYFELFNKPLLISNNEAASFKVGETEIKIALIDKTNNVNIYEVLRWIKPVAKSVYRFIGDLKSKDYTFIIYLSDEMPGSFSDVAQFGAMHRSNTSLYVLPKIKQKHRLEYLLQRTAMHELLHMFIPNQLKSNNYNTENFTNASAGKHLWLYEGVVEYFSLLLLLRNDFISEKTFLSEWEKKIEYTETHPKTSLIHLSENLNQGFYVNQYNNFYNKGALVAFFLDIELQQISYGEKSLIDVLSSLSKNEGIKNGFNDNEFIDLFIKEAKYDFLSFYEKYLLNRKKLKYNDHLNKIGFFLRDKIVEQRYNFGDVHIRYDQNNKNFVVANAGRNNFGLQKGDIIVAINKKVSSKITANEFYRLLLRPLKDELLHLQFIRRKTKYETSARAVFMTEKLKFYQLFEFEKLSNNQLRLKYQVLGNAKSGK